MTITVTDGPAYGLAWDKTAGTYTRVASAAGLTAGADFNAPSGGAWGLRRCNLWDDGTPTAYYGDRCYTDTDVAAMGQAMVQIPKFYYYMEYDAGTTTYYWFVTTVAATTIDVGLGVGAQAVKIHPAFTRDTVAKNNIYIGAYEGYFNATDSKLESKAAVTPTSSKTQAQSRTAAELRAGTTNLWEVSDFLSHCALQLLYLIEYGMFYAWSVIGHGITNDAATHNTGETTAYGNATYGTTANSTTAMSYRGVENWYGNIGKLLEGINFKADYMVWVADHDFATNWLAFAHPYVDTSLVTYAATDAYGTDIDTDATYDYAFIPNANAGGAIGAKICSRWTSVAGNKTLRNSPSYNTSTAGGAAFSGGLVANGTTGAARLMYMG